MLAHEIRAYLSSILRVIDFPHVLLFFQHFLRLLLLLLQLEELEHPFPLTFLVWASADTSSEAAVVHTLDDGNMFVLVDYQTEHFRYLTITVSQNPNVKSTKITVQY